MSKASYELVLLPGDGIGAEVMAEARTLIEVIATGTGVGFHLDEIPCGGKFYLEHGSRDWPEGSEARCRAADAILLGAVGWNGPDGQPVTMAGAMIQARALAVIRDLAYAAGYGRHGTTVLQEKNLGQSLAAALIRIDAREVVR